MQKVLCLFYFERGKLRVTSDWRIKEILLLRILTVTLGWGEINSFITLSYIMTITYLKAECVNYSQNKKILLRILTVTLGGGKN